MKILEFSNQAGREHCAIEKLLIEQNQNIFVFATLQPTVFIGYNVKYEAYNPNNKYNVPVTRFTGQGGPVYFDAGNIKTFLIADDVPDAKNNCIAWIIKSMADLGITLTNPDKSNDLLLGDKKVCGVSYLPINGKAQLAFFFSLHIDFDIAADVMFLTKNETDLKLRAIGINDVLKDPITAQQIKIALSNNFNQFWKENLATTSVTPDFSAKLPEVNDEINWIEKLQYNPDEPGIPNE